MFDRIQHRNLTGLAFSLTENFLNFIRMLPFTLKSSRTFSLTQYKRQVPAMAYNTIPCFLTWLCILHTYFAQCIFSFSTFFFIQSTLLCSFSLEHLGMSLSQALHFCFPSVPMGSIFTNFSFFFFKPKH